MPEAGSCIFCKAKSGESPTFEPPELYSLNRDPAESANRIKEGLTIVAQVAEQARAFSASIKPGPRLSAAKSPRRFQTGLMSLFAGLALFLAAIGIYGVLHYSVAQRTNEIGIRMALGARSATVVSMVIRPGMLLASISVGIGVAGALVA